MSKNISSFQLQKMINDLHRMKSILEKDQKGKIKIILSNNIYYYRE